MQDLDLYKNINGTYTSPKNGKVFNSLKSFRAHLAYKGHVSSTTFKSRLHNVSCKYCSKEIIVCSIKKHQEACYLNPKNTKYCEVCSKPVKDYKKSKGTCSRSCANKLFRTGANNGNWKENTYTSTCFLHHKKVCIVCGEYKIVAVHHNDENHHNNDPVNLIPLCPTHHQYVHSRFKCEVQPIIDNYIDNWKQDRRVAQAGSASGLVASSREFHRIKET